MGGSVRDMKGNEITEGCVVSDGLCAGTVFTAYEEQVCFLPEGTIGRKVAGHVFAKPENLLVIPNDIWKRATAGQQGESCQWVRLPTDVDGCPVNIGDVMEWPNGETFEVIGIGEDGTLFYVEGDGDIAAEWTTSWDKRHHGPDSWQRIIEDAIRGDGGSYGCLEERFNATVPALVARCEALAGSEGKGL